MSAKIRFGTDGWRAVIAEDYTFDNVRRCAQGFAEYLISEKFQNEWVVIGYDTRFQSERFAAVCAEVLVANGLRVYLTEGATPTPVISYSVVAWRPSLTHIEPSHTCFKDKVWLLFSL